MLVCVWERVVRVGVSYVRACERVVLACVCERVVCVCERVVLACVCERVVLACVSDGN